MYSISAKAKKHRAAIAVALFVVGAVSVAPQVAFILSLGKEYRGVPFFQTPNEDGYLAIMQEIADGHLLAPSVAFYEYKSASPLLPPTIPAFYAAASKLFHVSLVAVVAAGRFVLPALLFFLVYLFLYAAGGSESGGNKLNAIAGGLLVTLGFDLQDYRSLGRAFAGEWVFGDSLVWTRPVNPIAGAILIYLFLLCLWSVTARGKKRTVVPAALALALMMASYFFSWTLVLAVMGILGLIAVIRRETQSIRAFVTIFILGTLIAAPYWYMAWRASRSAWYAEAASRIGLLASRAPHLNKFLLLVLVIFLAASYLALWRGKRREGAPAWWLFSFAMLVGGFAAYNQQVFTGKEIWFYHFVFYTVPFGYTTLMLMLWHFLKPRYPRLWRAFVAALISVSLLFGAAVQVRGYRARAPAYRDMQKYADVFSFFRTQTPKDCVVLAEDETVRWSNLITALTACNTYVSGERSVIAPPERFYHNYLVLLRIRGVAADDIDAYLDIHREEATGLLYYQLQYALGFPDRKLAATLERLPADYREFTKRDFRTELERYRIDYMLSEGPLDENVRASLPGLRKIFESAGIFVYTFSS